MLYICLAVCIVSCLAVCTIAGSLWHLIDMIEEKIDDMSMLECKIAEHLPDAEDCVNSDLFD